MKYGIKFIENQKKKESNFIMEKSKKIIKNNEKAITLIALVITIIVLLILAGISISMLSGDNSILQKATDAKTSTIHANVLEQMQLEASAYTVNKTTGNYSNSLIDYLKGKSIISDISGEEDKWLINVTTLLGSNQSMGKGTYPNDVYVLEKQDTSTGSIVNKRVATTMPIRIAVTTTGQITYKITYYGNNTSDNLILGDLIDSDKTSNNLSQYQVRELQSDGMIALFDINTGKPTTFDNIYIIFNNQKINITNEKNHQDIYYTYDVENDSEIEETLEWDDLFLNSLPYYINVNGYGTLESGDYEFIIEKDNKEYEGTARVFGIE